MRSAADRIAELKASWASVCRAMAEGYWPGSEAAILLSVASYLLRTRRIDEPFLRRWFNWDVYLRELHPDSPVTFEAFLDALEADYAEYTFEFAAAESQVPAERLREIGAPVDLRAFRGIGRERARRRCVDRRGKGTPLAG